MSENVVPSRIANDNLTYCTSWVRLPSCLS